MDLAQAGSTCTHCPSSAGHQLSGNITLRVMEEETDCPKKGVLRADAAAFEPPPPGLGLLDKDPDCSEWASPSSTAAPSPWMSPLIMAAESPWNEFGSPWQAWSPGGLAGDSAFVLPEAHEGGLGETIEFDLMLEVGCGEQIPAKEESDVRKELQAAEKTDATVELQHSEDDLHEERQTPQPAFKLDGVSRLQSSLIALLSGLIPNACTGAEESAGAMTESTQASGAPTPKSLDTEIGATPGHFALSEAVKADLAAAASMTAKDVLLDNDEGKSGKPDLHPLPARVKRDVHQQQPASTTTTVVLQNVPKKYTVDGLQDHLKDKGYLEEVDFLYLPRDLRSKGNTGHAVLNFRTEEACKRFSSEFHNISSKAAFPGFNSKGRCEVTIADVQGKDAYVAKLQKSTLLMSMLEDTPEWLPRLFGEDGCPVKFPEQMSQ